MASYGKKSYWNERYARETEPCDWITDGYSVFKILLTPKFLYRHNAPPPGGEIVLQTLSKFNWRAHQDPSWFADEMGDVRQHDRGDRRVGTLPHDHTFVSSFPSREKCRVLQVGCGNSQLGEMMLKDGFADITNIDWSEVVIKKMQERYDDKFFAELHSCLERKEFLCNSLGLESRDDHDYAVNTSRKPKMAFEVGDISDGLNYPDESFDLIIAKKTLDVVLCGAGSVADARSMMSECFRLLNKDHGVMVVLSSAKPEDRAYFFENDPWSGVENIKFLLRLPSSDKLFRKRIESYVYILYKQSWRTQEY